MLESCGFPDLVASSYGGRNRLCSATFVERRLLQKSHSTTPTNLNSNSGTQTIVTATGVEAQSATIDNVSSHDLQLESLKLWREIEKELLNGQSMQGIETCIEVMDFLDELEKPDSVKFATLSVECGGIPKFNLIRKIGAIALKGEDPTTLLDH